MASDGTNMAGPPGAPKSLTDEATASASAGWAIVVARPPAENIGGVTLLDAIDPNELGLVTTTTFPGGENFFVLARGSFFFEDVTRVSVVE